MGTRSYINSIAIILLMAIVVFSACAGRSKSSELVIPPGSIFVTVIDYSELDGCEYLLEMEDGQKLQPVNLEEQFKNDGTKLFINYKKFDGVGICMAGTMVTLSSQQLASNKTK